jgi:hypothetical protein
MGEFVAGSVEEILRGTGGVNYEIATVRCGGPGLEIPCTCDWNKLAHQAECPTNRITEYPNEGNGVSPAVAYQQVLECSDRDILIYAHDDLTIHDTDWLPRILRRFVYSDSRCVAVGLGGAVGLGTADLYRKPYSIWNLARQSYASNQDDAEVHGERFAGVRRCAVIEQFFMAIRTDWLRSIGGWPVQHLSHHGLDMWIACEAARSGKEIWQVGVSCHHAGGASSTKEIYTKAHWLQGGNAASDHEIPHRWIFDSYRDVLPIRT